MARDYRVVERLHLGIPTPNVNASPDRTPLPTNDCFGFGAFSRDSTVRACACVGGPNCCIEVAKRQHEADIRADERRKVLAEIAEKEAACPQ